MIGSLPGVLNIASLYYCAVDASTPTFVRLFGLFALFYLAFPIDLIPDVLMLLFGLGALDDRSAAEQNNTEKPLWRNW